MKKFIYAFVGIIAIMLSSCEHDIVIENYIPDGSNGFVKDTTKTDYLRLTANIEAQAVTRVLNNQWEVNDAIGVFFDDGGLLAAIADNKKFITGSGDGTFVAEAGEVFFRSSNSHEVKAYYPYKEGITFNDQIDFDVELADATPAGQKKNDFLYAETTVNWGETANLVFKHQMSKIVLNIITGDGFKGTEIGGKASEEFVNGKMRIAGLPIKGTFTIVPNEVSSSTEACNQTITVGTQISDTEKAHCYTLEYIVPPFGLNDMTPKFSFESDGLNLLLSCSLTSINSHNSFDAGYVYTYNITMSKDNLRIESCTIEPWIDGGSEDISTELVP